MAVVYPTYPVTTLAQAEDMIIFTGNQIHDIMNADATSVVEAEDGQIPSIRKALVDNMYFKNPQIWVSSTQVTDPLQLKQFTDGGWYFAPTATVSTPVSLGATPIGDTNWKPWNKDQSATYQHAKRLAAEAGYNMVSGSFYFGGTLDSADDVLFYEGDGKYYSWSGALPKVVPAGSTPETSGGVGTTMWVDRTDLTLRSDINIVIKTFNSVYEMIADDSLIVGQIVKTNAYYSGWAAENHLPIGGSEYTLLGLSDARNVIGSDSWVPDGIENFYSVVGDGTEYVLLHNRELRSVFELSKFGASRYRSQSENSAAINAAWTALSFEGSGQIVFEDMYDVGGNEITLSIKNNMTSKSSYSLVGKSATFADQQTTFNNSVGFGVKSTSPSIIKWGSTTADMKGLGLLKDLSIYSQTLNQIGLDFANAFTRSNIICDLDNVRLVDFEGSNSFIINQGRCVDSVWSNIKLFGKGSQPFAGIKVTRELPTLISPQFNFCGRSLYVTAATNAYFNVIGGWSIQPSVAHISFQGGSITHLMTSSAHGFSMLETTGVTSTPIICETPSGCSAYLSLSGCQMDSSLTSSSGRAIDFQCGGRLKIDNCKLNPASTARNIKLGSYTVFTAINCEGFTMEDSTFSQVTAINSGIAAFGSSIGATGTNTVPTTYKSGFAYLDNGANTARKRAGWRFYDAGSSTFLDMHPQFESKNTLTGTPNAWIKTYMPDGTPIWLHATTTAPV